MKLIALLLCGCLLLGGCSTQPSQADGAQAPSPPGEDAPAPPEEQPGQSPADGGGENPGETGSTAEETASPDDGAPGEESSPVQTLDAEGQPGDADGASGTSTEADNADGQAAGGDTEGQAGDESETAGDTAPAASDDTSSRGSRAEQADPSAAQTQGNTVTGTVASIVGNEVTLTLSGEQEGEQAVYLLPVGMAIGRGDFSTVSTGNRLRITFGTDPQDGSEIITAVTILP